MATATLLEPATIERPRMGRPKKDFETESVKLHKDVLEKARTLIALRRRREPRLTLSDYLSKILSPVVERDYRAEKKRLVEED